MIVLKLENASFENEVLNYNGKVLVDFYADWCGPCKMMSPIIDSIAEELGEKVKVGKINIDENQELAIKYQVMSIPTIMIFNNGTILKSFIGVTDKQEILDCLN